MSALTFDKFKKMLLYHLHYTRKQRYNAAATIQTAQRKRFTINPDLREALCNPTTAKNDIYIQDIKIQIKKIMALIF